MWLCVDPPIICCFSGKIRFGVFCFLFSHNQIKLWVMCVSGLCTLPAAKISDCSHTPPYCEAR